MEIKKETALKIFNTVYGYTEIDDEEFNEWFDERKDGEGELAITRDDMSKFEGERYRDYQVAKGLRRGTVTSERQGDFWVVFFDGEGLNVN